MITEVEMTILAAARGICKQVAQEHYQTRCGGKADMAEAVLTDLILTLGINGGAPGYNAAVGVAEPDPEPEPQNLSEKMYGVPDSRKV